MHNIMVASTVPFWPIVHHIQKKLFFLIRLKSKENLSAISGDFFPKIVNNRSKRNSTLYSNYIATLTHYDPIGKQS